MTFGRVVVQDEGNDAGQSLTALAPDCAALKWRTGRPVKDEADVETVFASVAPRPLDR